MSQTPSGSQQQQSTAPPMLQEVEHVPDVLTTERIQQLLDENAAMIKAIIDCQNVGKLDKAAQYVIMVAVCTHIPLDTVCCFTYNLFRFAKVSHVVAAKFDILGGGRRCTDGGQGCCTFRCTATDGHKFINYNTTKCTLMMVSSLVLAPSLHFIPRCTDTSASASTAIHSTLADGERAAACRNDCITHAGSGTGLFGIGMVGDDGVQCCCIHGWASRLGMVAL